MGRKPVKKEEIEAFKGALHERCGNCNNSFLTEAKLAVGQHKKKTVTLASLSGGFN